MSFQSDRGTRCKRVYSIFPPWAATWQPFHLVPRHWLLERSGFGCQCRLRNVLVVIHILTLGLVAGEDDLSRVDA
jgi:hypothetical protein